MKRLVAIGILAALACSAQTPQVGTLMRVTTGEEYLGTAHSVGGIEMPIMRTDQVYVITGEGMEYVVVERNVPPAHVVINDSILYRLVGDQFSFLDREGRPHPARIVRQTLIDPNLRASTLPVIVPTMAPVFTPSFASPTVWKDLNGGARYSVQKSAGAIYAEQIVRKKKAVPVKIDATWRSEQSQFVGLVYWTAGKCSFSSEVNLESTPGRVKGYVSFPAPGAKLDKKRCHYDDVRSYPLAWVPE